MLEQLRLCIDFLRCDDALQATRACKDFAAIPLVRLKTKFAVRERELNQDIRDEAERRRLRHAGGDISEQLSVYSLGFSTDSDGHWHEHKHSGYN